MMTVIGLNQPPEIRKERWSNMLEARATVRTLRHDPNERAQRMVEMDRLFYSQTLTKYVT